jgi:energy-coupling factor transporter ATP-binding protein EcfA2
MLKAIRFRVQNFRNIDDSGWIPLEKVIAFVGRNESGKTTLLKALHKFNPATPEPYNPQREFPRDRYTREFRNGADWPVCSVAFEIGEPLRQEIEAILDGSPPPQEAICTRFYDGSLQIQFEPAVHNAAIKPAPLIDALKTFASAARRLEAPVSEQEDQTKKLRTDLATWASAWQEKCGAHVDLRNQDGVTLLLNLRTESDKHATPQTADMVEALQSVVDPALAAAKKIPVVDQIAELLKARLPVLIYFDDYGVLDSAIYLPNF